MCDLKPINCDIKKECVCVHTDIDREKQKLYNTLKEKFLNTLQSKILLNFNFETCWNLHYITYNLKASDFPILSKYSDKNDDNKYNQNIIQTIINQILEETMFNGIKKIHLTWYKTDSYNDCILSLTVYLTEEENSRIKNIIND